MSAPYDLKYADLWHISSHLSVMQILTRLERLDRLESWLKSEDALILRDAAAELGVSLRTIHRDLDLLRERGVPVESERGRGGGVRVSSGWGIGRITLSRHEALDLLVGIAIGSVVHSALQMGHTLAIQRKLMATFSKAEQRRIAAMRRRIRVGRLASSAMFDSLSEMREQVGDKLKEAFALNLALNVTYVDEKRKRTERLVEPHFLVLNPPVWYVVCWDHLRQDARTFRCDRIQCAVVTRKAFVPQPWSDFASTMEGNPTSEV